MSLNQRITPNLSEAPRFQQAPVHFQGGFTLIELMVVLAIMGILISVASGAYTAMQDKYRAQTAVEQIRSVLTSARLSALSQGQSVYVTINYSSGATAVKNSVSATHLGGIYSTANKVVTGNERKLEGVFVYKASTASNGCVKVSGADKWKAISFSARATVIDITNTGAPSIIVSTDAAGLKDAHCLQVRPITGRVALMKL